MCACPASQRRGALRAAGECAQVFADGVTAGQHVGKAIDAVHVSRRLCDRRTLRVQQFDGYTGERWVAATGSITSQVVVLVTAEADADVCHFL